MSKFKVTSYKDHNGRMRYTVHDVPIFGAVGTHKLEDGSEYVFDDNYVRETYQTMKTYEDIDEIRPAHENHWNFNQWFEGKIPSPDYHCPNFAKLVNFSLVEKDSEPYIHTDITALTWKDLNDLEVYGGRSVQILNPEKKKIDSLAFIKSMPPAKKGLGQIELDLSGVEEPRDEMERALSLKTISDTSEYVLGNMINFSETNKETFRKAAVPFLVEEENVTKKDKKNKAAKFQDNPDDKKPEDENVDSGDGMEDDTDVENMDMENMDDADSAENMDDMDDMDFGDDDDVEDELEKSDASPEVKEVAVILEDGIEDKLEENNLKLLEKIQFMLDKTMLQIQQVIGGTNNNGGGQVMSGGTAPGGFSEKAKNRATAFFSEMVSGIKKIEAVQIKPNDETVVSRSKPVLEQLAKHEMEAVANFNKGNIDGVIACFSEINKAVKESLPDEVNPPNMTDNLKKIVGQKYASGVPAHLRENPGVEEAWKEFLTGERVHDQETGKTRCAASFREPKNIRDPKEAKKAKEDAFLTYYNTVYKPHKEIRQNTVITPVE